MGEWGAKGWGERVVHERVRRGGRAEGVLEGEGGIQSLQSVAAAEAVVRTIVAAGGRVGGRRYGP